MILNLFPEPNIIGNNIEFNIPVIHLDCQKEFEIGLKKIHFKVTNDSKSNINKSELWYLSSSLIDKSVLNVQQSLSYFTFDNKSLVQFYEPTYPVYYKIQSHNLESSQFCLRAAYRDTPKIDIKNCFLQLEIREHYGWFQQNYKR